MSETAAPRFAAGAPRRILFVEAQFRGFIHATFNSCVLETLSRAFPDAELTFAAEARQQAEVRTLIEAREPWPRAGLDFAELEIGPDCYATRSQEWAVSRRILDLAARRRCDLVVLASATWAQMLGLSFARRPPGLAGVVACLHDHPAMFRAQGAKGALSATVRRILFDHASPLRGFVCFSEAARRAAIVALRPRKVAIRSIDPPYRRLAAAATPAAAERRPGFRIGWLGNTGKGNFARFVEVAHRARQLHPEVEFRLAGYASLPLGDNALALFAEPPSRDLISSERLEAILASLDYGVLWTDSSNYEYRISAAFLDAVVRDLPTLCLRTVFLEEFFARHGRCGELCDSEDDLERAILRVAAAAGDAVPPELRANLRRASAAIHPAAVAPELRAAIRTLLPIGRGAS